jgi:hypothetical protein
MRTRRTFQDEEDLPVDRDVGGVSNRPCVFELRCESGVFDGGEASLIQNRRTGRARDGRVECCTARADGRVHDTVASWVLYACGLGVELLSNLKLIVIRYAREGGCLWSRLVGRGVINDPDHIEVVPTGDWLAVHGAGNQGHINGSRFHSAGSSIRGSRRGLENRPGGDAAKPVRRPLARRCRAKSAGLQGRNLEDRESNGGRLYWAALRARSTRLCKRR